MTSCLFNLSGFGSLHALHSRPDVHCGGGTLSLPVQQVLVNVLAKLPAREAVRLQRVSQ